MPKHTPDPVRSAAAKKAAATRRRNAAAKNTPAQQADDPVMFQPAAPTPVAITSEALPVGVIDAEPVDGQVIVKVLSVELRPNVYLTAKCFSFQPEESIAIGRMLIDEGTKAQGQRSGLVLPGVTPA